MKLIYYILPIIFHIALLPFWFLEKSTGITALVQLALGGLVTPIYLIILNFTSVDNTNLGKLIIQLILMIVITGIGILISYFNWGISTGNLLTPDSETIHIIHLEIIISSFIVMLGWVILTIIRYKK